MLGKRALEILGGLAANAPAFTADEIEELLAAGLAVEADPRHVAIVAWLAPIVSEHAGVELGDGLTAANLMAALAELDGKLKRDWYRFTTSDTKLAAQEQARIAIRRALGVVNDPITYGAIEKLLDQTRALPEGARFTACTELGDELYAITREGARVGHELQVRIARFGEAPFAAFLAAHAKVTAKMQAFAGEIRTLSSSIGHVKKNPHQVVIGLAKSSLPAKQAVSQYRAVLQKSRATPADVAVTCVRNIGESGGAVAVQQRLAAARKALRRSGVPYSPVVEGAAKTLLAFEPLEDGAARFRALYNEVSKQGFLAGDVIVKVVARLMPADGTPVEAVARMVLAYRLLREVPSQLRGGAKPSGLAAAALASMVAADALPALVQRYRELERALVDARASSLQFADDDALECIACPGTPAEVAATVHGLLGQLAAEREPQRYDVAIAAAFAKRFAY